MSRSVKDTPALSCIEGNFGWNLTHLIRYAAGAGLCSCRGRRKWAAYAWCRNVFELRTSIRAEVSISRNSCCSVLLGCYSLLFQDRELQNDRGVGDEVAAQCTGFQTWQPNSNLASQERLHSTARECEGLLAGRVREGQAWSSMAKPMVKPMFKHVQTAFCNLCITCYHICKEIC